MVFHGHTKKAVYEGKLEGTRLVPVQTLTSAVFLSSGLAGIYLFLKADYTGSFLVACISTQAWRCLSESMRADHRGKGPVSPYQIMSAAAILYALFLSMFLPNEAPRTDLAAGLRWLWSPAVLLSLQVIWLITFLFTGQSKVTGSHLTFHVRENRI